MLLVLVPIGYIMAMAFLAAMFPKSESWLFMCLPVGLLLLLIYSSAYVYRTYRMMKDTEGMMMKLFTAPSDARLIEAVERAMGEAGFPYTRLTGSTASGVRERFLLVRHAVYRLPDLHASLMVSIGYDPDGQYPGKTLHLGPVNSDNFGGIVRLAEELDSIDIELAIQLGR